MNLSSFHYFITRARERNFTRAAQQLHITQQSLSAHIAALEEELGCPLLVRHTPLELTYAGTVFLQRAMNLQQALVDLRREFCDITEKQQGILRIGVAATRGRALMPRLIVAFQQEYPHIKIELMESINKTIQHHLLQGDIDLAIGYFPGNIPEVELRDFYREEVRLFMSQEFLAKLTANGTAPNAKALARGDLSSLHACPFVLTNLDNIAGQFSSMLFAKAHIRPLVKAKSDNMETLLELCLRGVGACFCPPNLANAVLSDRELAALQSYPLGKQTQYHIRFGFLKTNYQWKIISEFIRLATELIH